MKLINLFNNIFMPDIKQNTGSNNTGNRNSGYFNSGYCNSGNRNSGYFNSGDCNSGYFNSGDCNSGYFNSGYFNSGDCNSGYCNSGNRNSGGFNTTEPNAVFFGIDTGKKWDEIDHPHFAEFYTNKWISESDMTADEKIADPNYFVRQGYLRTYTYKEAWANFWRDTDEKNRQKFLALPNFNADIFKDITGVDVTVKPCCKQNCEYTYCPNCGHKLK